MTYVVDVYLAWVCCECYNSLSLIFHQRRICVVMERVVRASPAKGGCWSGAPLDASHGYANEKPLNKMVALKVPKRHPIFSCMFGKLKGENVGKYPRPRQHPVCHPRERGEWRPFCGPGGPFTCFRHLCVQLRPQYLSSLLFLWLFLPQVTFFSK